MNLKNYIRILTVLFASIVLFAFLPGSKNALEESLVGHWSFDEEGNTAIDKSSFESHGEVKGNPKRSIGIVGKGCLVLDGEGDYLEILKAGKTPAQFHNLEKGSISIWFKARSIPNESSICPLFYYGSSNGCENMKDASNEGLVIEIAHGGIKKESKGIYFTVFNNPCKFPSFCFDTHSEAHLEDTQGKIKEGEWYHFVAVVGENFNTGYLNGEEINYRHYNFSDANASQFFSNSLKHERMWIGKGFWNHGKETYFDGFIDDLRIYNVPLNSEEVRNLYNMKNAD